LEPDAFCLKVRDGLNQAEPLLGFRDYTPNSIARDFREDPGAPGL
jgi:hypothetical protein